MTSINGKVDIFEDYEKLGTYHLYLNKESTNPLVYMTILKYIAYHVFGTDSMCQYYSRVPGSIETNYLNPIYYINNVAHISDTKINYVDSSVLKGIPKCKYLVVLHFDEEPIQHDTSLVIKVVKGEGLFDTIISINELEDSNIIPIANIKLTMVHNGIETYGELLEQEEIDLQ